MAHQAGRMGPDRGRERFDLTVVQRTDSAGQTHESEPGGESGMPGKPSAAQCDSRQQTPCHPQTRKGVPSALSRVRLLTRLVRARQPPSIFGHRHRPTDKCSSNTSPSDRTKDRKICASLHPLTHCTNSAADRPMHHNATPTGESIIPPGLQPGGSHRNHNDRVSSRRSPPGGPPQASHRRPRGQPALCRCSFCETRLRQLSPRRVHRAR